MVRPKSQGSLTEDFPIDNVADGFRIWLQLALLNALEDAGRATRLLRSLATDVYDAYMAAQHAYGRGADPEEEETAASSAEERFKAICHGITALLGEADHWVSGELEAQLESVPSDDWSRARGTDRVRWLLLVDEPERHLHPRLQREAAEWLGAMAAIRHAPLVVATHSPAFLSLPADAATYVSVHRTSDDVRLVPFSPAALDALDELCTEMGFDRGELVGLIDLWLVVEGETDTAVLKSLYENELIELGIEVVPMHGSAKWQALLEADALWRFTTAPVAVMFDGVSPETVDSLKAAADEELTQISRDAKRPSTEKTSPFLFAACAASAGPSTRSPIAEPTFLICSTRNRLKRSSPDYPGHADAQAAWEKHNKGKRDEFMRTRYGVEKRAEKFKAIAEHFVDNKKRSGTLDAVLAACASLAG
jgi:hypothetical protein